MARNRQILVLLTTRKNTDPQADQLFGLSFFSNICINVVEYQMIYDAHINVYNLYRIVLTFHIIGNKFINLLIRPSVGARFHYLFININKLQIVGSLKC